MNSDVIVFSVVLAIGSLIMYAGYLMGHQSGMDEGHRIGFDLGKAVGRAQMASEDVL